MSLEKNCVILKEVFKVNLCFLFSYLDFSFLLNNYIVEMLNKSILCIFC